MFKQIFVLLPLEGASRPAHAPSCTQLHPASSGSLPPRPAAPLCGHRPDFMELGTPPMELPVESQSAETGKGPPPQARGPVEVKRGAQHAGSWPWQAVALIPLIWALVSLENTATISFRQL